MSELGQPPALSVLDLFTIGVGPSSSHTVGPMRAAARFAGLAVGDGTPQRLSCELFGSLALTGRGHATDIAILLGLSGWTPEGVNPDDISGIIECIRTKQSLALAGKIDVSFIETRDLCFMFGKFLPGHANAMRFTAHFDDGRELSRIFYSIGGGAIRMEGQESARRNVALKHPFFSGKELLEIGNAQGLSIAEIVWANEASWRSHSETIEFLDTVRDAMLACIERGYSQDGVLPGGLQVQRRAKALHEGLKDRDICDDPSLIFEWVSLYALSVNEENAAGGRVVTAPTNGAAGIVPAVLKYYETFQPGASLEGSRILLTTAAAIGFLYKMRASISAAEMGCQGEVGVACSMAAAGLVAALGGTNEQIENGAEIGMEHNLGLTCDPIGGLVQVPCIERNTMGAVKAITAARLALQGDGRHVVSLDAVIETMRQTGRDMRSQYKETSLGGLAVNVVEC